MERRTITVGALCYCLHTQWLAVKHEMKAGHTKLPYTSTGSLTIEIDEFGDKNRFTVVRRTELSGSPALSRPRALTTAAAAAVACASDLFATERYLSPRSGL